MPTNYKTIEEAGDIKGKKVLLRLDLNVPLVGDEIRDDFRIKQALPTISLLKKKGARTIIISHLDNSDTFSLGRVASYINKIIPLAFVKKLDELTKVVPTMKDGDVMMFENLRLNSGEKENDSVFANELSRVADIFVNDAFSVCHREHASIVSLPRLLPSYAGPLLDREIRELSKSFNPSHPFLFILGGAKFDTKIPLIQKFLDIADNVFVGGALANDVFKDHGFEIGRSLTSKLPPAFLGISRNPRLIVPPDVVVASPEMTENRLPQKVGPEDKIMDAGPQTIAMLSDLLSEAKFVLWNGPLGDYEKGFDKGTKDLANAIAESSATSIIGGGDTVAVVSKMGILDKFTFVSTGGGAMLDFLAKGTLPGIEALKN